MKNLGKRCLRPTQVTKITDGKAEYLNQNAGIKTPSLHVEPLIMLLQLEDWQSQRSFHVLIVAIQRKNMTTIEDLSVSTGLKFKLFALYATISVIIDFVLISVPLEEFFNLVDLLGS